MPNRRWFFPRYFVFTDEKGEVLGKAATLWVLLDLETRKMAAPGDVAQHLPDNSDLTAPMGMPGNVPKLEGAEEEMLSRMPVFTDLDVNGHVNNTKYADWACDALGIDTMQKYELKSLLVNYAAEIRPGQEMTLHASHENGLYRVSGSHEGKQHFEVGGELRERK